MVDESGRPELVLHTAHDVEVGQTGLDHHHVRAFLEIEPDFPQRLIAVGAVHLVGVLIAAAQALCRAHRVAERSVEAGGVLRRIGEDAGMYEFLLVERDADRTDASVHHV
ncbi:hypothetical protein D3C83_16190 [compost metagenome]